MKISVIIPSYKPKDYLWECLDSLKKQTFPLNEFEIIIVLNGCNEPYNSDILNYITQNLSNISTRLIQQDLGGVSNARNRGIDEAKGKYLALIDDDDYVSETYLQELYDIAEQGFMPVSNILAFVDGKEGTIPYRISDLFEKRKNKAYSSINEMRSFMSVPVAKILLAKGTVCSRRFNPLLKFGEDSLFMFEVSDCINRIKCTSSDAIYFRRYREGSAVTQQKSVNEILHDTFKFYGACFCVWLRKPFSYNFLFFLSRLAGGLLSTSRRLKNRRNNIYTN